MSHEEFVHTSLDDTVQSLKLNLLKKLRDNKDSELAPVSSGDSGIRVKVGNFKFTASWIRWRTKDIRQSW